MLSLNTIIAWIVNDYHELRNIIITNLLLPLGHISNNSEGWRHQMEALIGMSPQEPEVEDGGKKDRVPAGAPFTWIAANFAHCPEDADDEVIQRYARVYMWYVISRTIFADGTGKNAPWMWLKALTVLDNKFSWGSAALAYLYRQVINC